MRKLRGHAPLFLLAVALAAFVGGTALAGPIADVARKITGKDIAKNAIVSKHVKKNALKSADVSGLKVADFAAGTRDALKGERGAKGETGDTGAAGAKGETGATGAAGANGTNGTNGTNGADATGLTMGTGVVTSNTTRFTSLGGTGGGGLSTVEAPGITPNRTLTLNDFAFRVPALVAAETVTVTVQVNNVDTALTCTATAAAETCTDSDTLNLPPRTLVGIKLVTSMLGAGTRFPSWSWTFTQG